MNKSINKLLKKREFGFLIITLSLLLAFWLMNLDSLVMLVVDLSNCAMEIDEFSAFVFVDNCRFSSQILEIILSIILSGFMALKKISIPLAIFGSYVGLLWFCVRPNIRLKKKK